MNHVFHKQNRVADSLAKKGTKVAVFYEQDILLASSSSLCQKKVEVELLVSRLTINISNNFYGQDMTQFNRNGHTT